MATKSESWPKMVDLSSVESEGEQSLAPTHHSRSTELDQPEAYHGQFSNEWKHWKPCNECGFTFDPETEDRLFVAETSKGHGIVQFTGADGSNRFCIVGFKVIMARAEWKWVPGLQWRQTNVRDDIQIDVARSILATHGQHCRHTIGNAGEQITRPAENAHRVNAQMDQLKNTQRATATESTTSRMKTRSSDMNNKRVDYRMWPKAKVAKGTRRSDRNIRIATAPRTQPGTGTTVNQAALRFMAGKAVAGGSEHSAPNSALRQRRSTSPGVNQPMLEVLMRSAVAVGTSLEDVYQFADRKSRGL